MIFLIIEIILTICAWKNGWRWLSLLPIGIGMSISFFIGFGVGLAGGDVSIINLWWLDVLAIIALCFMCFKKHKKN